MADVVFEKNITIRGKIECKTGILIGGTEEGIEIGGVDKTFVRDPFTKRPLIPGSSLKGKMRSLIELREKKYSQDGSPHGHGSKCDDENCDICTVFGSTSDTLRGPTRLIVRDSLMDDDLIIGEHKTENVINRLTGKADYPRTFERVPAGSTFSFEMVFGVYNAKDRQRLRLVFEAMSMLEDSYLGSSGSRGYGKIEFKNIKISSKSKEDYLKGIEGKEVEIDGAKEFTTRTLLERFEELEKCLGFI